MIPFPTVRSRQAMVCSADHLATQAGMETLAAGGNAVDAAIATNAAMAVVAPHLCGMGGDLFAIVHRDGQVAPDVLNASGRAGSGVDPVALRAEGHVVMPFHHDVRTVTVPGCVDGWLTLHDRYGSLALERTLTPAIRLAEEGFPASPLLTAVLVALDHAGRANLRELVEQATRRGRARAPAWRRPCPASDRRHRSRRLLWG